MDNPKGGKSRSQTQNDKKHMAGEWGEVDIY